MIPLRDANPTRRFPFFTLLLIAANIFIFFKFMLFSDNQVAFINSFALVPKDIKKIFFLKKEFNFNYLIRFITSIFMHGSLLHLISNCWFLWIFGDNVESKIGHFKYLIFYLFCGIIASLVHIFTTFSPHIPVIGASGAIAGVMGAYLVYYPNARIYTFVPIIFIWIVPIPAIVFLIMWFIGQLLNGMFEIIKAGENVSNIAFWAHIGGFVTGVVFAPLFKKKNYY